MSLTMMQNLCSMAERAGLLASLNATLRCRSTTCVTFCHHRHARMLHMQGQVTGDTGWLPCDRWHVVQASAVVDRIRRALATTSDNVSTRIGPIAKAFGNAFGVDDWYTSFSPALSTASSFLPSCFRSWRWSCALSDCDPAYTWSASKVRAGGDLLAVIAQVPCAHARYVELFAEEVVRGGPAFAVSLVLSALEPVLRAAAELGAWQIISPVNALGRVEVVGGLHEVQDKVRPSR